MAETYTDAQLVELAKTLSAKRGGNSRFTQIKRRQDFGRDFEVHEYESPKGVGYEIRMYKTVDGVDFIKRVGFGAEASSRTHKWEEIPELI